MTECGKVDAGGVWERRSDAEGGNRGVPHSFKRASVSGVSIFGIWLSAWEAFARRGEAEGGEVGAGGVQERRSDAEVGNHKVPHSL